MSVAPTSTSDLSGLPPMDCPWCGAPSENVKVHSVETAADGRTAHFLIECAVCLTKDKAQIMRRTPDWMEAARGR